MRINCATAGAVLALCLAASGAIVPEVTDVQFAQPNGSRRVAITYTLANAPAIVTVDICTNGVSIGDANLHYFTGDVNRLVTNKTAATETHTAVWQADKSWPGRVITDASVTAVVRAWATDNPPDYMVVDLVAENTVNYYTSADALPDGGLANDVYRTERLVMRRIHAKGETFMMGANELSPDDPLYASERPHQAQLDHDYWMAIYELTVAQYDAIPGPTRTYNAWATGMRPRINLNYNVLRESSGNGANAACRYPNPPAANSLLGILRAKTGLAFDLPGEAEWEYACRAGSRAGQWNDGSEYVIDVTLFNTGAASGADRGLHVVDSNLERLGRYRKNGGMDYNGNTWGNFSSWNVDPATGGTAEVGSYAPNAWGLYDMHGNAREICLDYFKEDITGDCGAVNTTANSDGTHVLRGGSLQDGPILCRSGSRAFRAAGHTTSSERRDEVEGCRLVCPIGE